MCVRGVEMRGSCPDYVFSPRTGFISAIWGLFHHCSQSSLGSFLNGIVFEENRSVLIEMEFEREIGPTIAFI